MKTLAEEKLNRVYLFTTQSGADAEGEKASENMVGKGEMLVISIFSFFLPCFLPYHSIIILIHISRQHMLLIWSMPKFCRLVTS